MGPVRKAAVVGLLEWVRRNKPEVRSLSSLNEDRFMELVTEYELSKGVRAINDRSSNLRAKWRSAHYCISNYSTDREALAVYPE
jgi:hypothetical protein